MEILRNGLLLIGLIGLILTYGILIRHAFQRDVLWGVFALFCTPIGGWLHGFTERHRDRRIVLLNVCALVLLAGGLYAVPRTPLTGYWATEDRSLLVRFESDGRIRNFELGDDATYAFRGRKLATIEFSALPSSTRLRIDGLGEFTYGYYQPTRGLIDLYTSRTDPEGGLRTDRPDEHRRLVRLVEPLDPATHAMIASLEKREAVLGAVRAFLAHPTRPPLGPNVMSRYAFHMNAARTWDAATLARQPFPHIVETLRMRAMHGPALRAGAAPADLFQIDLLADRFRIQKLVTHEPADIRLYPGETQAYVALRDTRGDGGPELAHLTAEEHPDGRWGIDVDWHRMLDLPAHRADGAPRTVDEAIVYLRETYGLTPSAAWLQPAR